MKLSARVACDLLHRDIPQFGLLNKNEQQIEGYLPICKTLFCVAML